MMEDYAGLAFFCASLPILVWSFYTDLRYMKITNRANLALFAIFLLLGLIFLDLGTYGTRLVQAGVMFVIGYLLNMGRIMGGGDSKLLAASAPYFELSHVPSAILLLAIFALVSVVLHRVLGLIPAFKRLVSDWVSWNNPKVFPYGVPITATICVYLFINTGLLAF